jgi:hypothetical protein
MTKGSKCSFNNVHFHITSEAPSVNGVSFKLQELTAVNICDSMMQLKIVCMQDAVGIMNG